MGLLLVPDAVTTWLHRRIEHKADRFNLLTSKNCPYLGFVDIPESLNILDVGSEEARAVVGCIEHWILCMIELLYSGTVTWWPFSYSACFLLKLNYAFTMIFVHEYIIYDEIYHYHQWIYMVFKVVRTCPSVYSFIARQSSQVLEILFPMLYYGRELPNEWSWMVFAEKKRGGNGSYAHLQFE